MGGSGPLGEGSGVVTPVALENFHMLKQRQRSDTFIDQADGRERVNLLNWDGRGGAGPLLTPADAPEPDEARP